MDKRDKILNNVAKEYMVAWNLVAFAKTHKILHGVIKIAMEKYAMSRVKERFGNKEKVTKINVILCENKYSGKYSLRDEDGLFWTGFNTNIWISETGNKSNEIWETKSKKLAKAIRDLFNNKNYDKI